LQGAQVQRNGFDSGDGQPCFSVLSRVSPPSFPPPEFPPSYPSRSGSSSRRPARVT
jgi:hypothetical protein